MKNSSVNCVVDASVGIKLFVKEEFSEQAHALFAHLTATPPAQLHVPDLFFIECTNILWKYTRRFNYQAEKADRHLVNLENLALQSFVVKRPSQPTAIQAKVSRSETLA